MKKKEQRNIAKKLASFELIIQNSSDKNEIQKAKNEIMTLAGHIGSLEDITAIDEMVQEFLSEKIS